MTSFKIIDIEIIPLAISFEQTIIELVDMMKILIINTPKIKKDFLEAPEVTGLSVELNDKATKYILDLKKKPGISVK